MQIASQDATAPLDHCFAEVDDGASWLRANVAPICFDVFGIGGEDLEAAKYVEEQGYAADVEVSEKVDPMISELLWAAFKETE